MKLTRRRLLRATAGTTVAGAISGCIGQNNGSSSQNNGSSSQNNAAPTIVHGSAPGAELTDYASMFRQSDHILQEVMTNAGDTYESEVAMFGGSPQIVAGMSGGECDLGVFSPPSAASAAIEGTIDSGYSLIVPAKYQGVENHFSDNLYTLSNGGLESPSDFEGATVAVQAYGSAVALIGRTSLKTAGVDISKVTFREVEFGAMPAALREGRVDAATLIQPFVAMMGDEVSLIEGVRNPMGKFMELAIGGSVNFIEENESIVQDWLQDHWEALQWWNNEDNHDQVISIAAEVTELDEALLDQILYTDQNYYLGWGGLKMDPHCYQIPISRLNELDYISEEVEIAQYMDNSYLSDVATESGITCE